MTRHTVRCTLALVPLLITGCVSIGPQALTDRVNRDAGTFTAGDLTLRPAGPPSGADATRIAQQLQQPVGQVEAVQLALLNSPALQTLLANAWAAAADAAQSGRIANPVLSFERMIRGDTREFSRALSIGLMDILSLPWRQQAARHRLEQVQVQLTGQVVDQVTQVRLAWVDAVADQEDLAYARQIYDSAGASAELARRMQAAGNFNRLSRAREQAFHADAAAQLLRSQQRATASREALVRLLGLNDTQAVQLQLPGRLPDLPAEPRALDTMGAQALRERLDIRLAQEALTAAGREQGLSFAASLTDLELTARSTTEFDNRPEGTESSQARGGEIAVRLPVFDAGDLQRDRWNARTLAAAHHLEDTVRSSASQLREQVGTYRLAYDLARHYREEIIPLRKTISRENLLRYNGMLIGVFELLADARDQVGAMQAALAAQRQFWRADATLTAVLMGRPATAPDSRTATATADSAGMAPGGH